MALHLRTGETALSVDRADGTTADGEPLDARLTTLRRTDRAETVLLVVDGRPRVATVERDGATTRVWVDGAPIEVDVRTDADLLLERFGLDTGDAAADREVHAPMPGLVLRVLVAPGDAVEAGQGVVVLEAMKMENELTAPAAGTVAAVHAAPGDAVAKNDLLIEVDV
ncbi:acetyl-CoA carboxylase biotin carboxyl carrier protein subunit [Rubrivirga sp.]|uniref:acetyl-CoA carboxylase biotin carboxyl carrier protein subunit n=1 Tax=Rubrivirga sp. TaxID=1885344 RepID=UPI003B51D6EF